MIGFVGVGKSILSSKNIPTKKIRKNKIKSDLVTLSGCDTGFGIGFGDDLDGLVRSFLIAGAKSVLASSWIIDDESTSYFMGEYYRYLRLYSKSKSLRLAQNKAKKKYPAPYYWAGFKLYGAQN